MQVAQATVTVKSTWRPRLARIAIVTIVQHIKTDLNGVFRSRITDTDSHSDSDTHHLRSPASLALLKTIIYPNFMIAISIPGLGTCVEF